MPSEPLQVFKYKINHFLSSLPMTVSIGSFSKRLFEKYRIEEEVFTRDRLIKNDDHSQIPLERLEIYAREFRIPVEALHSKNNVQESQKK